MSNVSDLTLEILQRIQADMAEMKADIRELKADMAEMKADMRGLRAEMAMLTDRVDMLTVRMDEGFVRVNRRIDGVIEMFGRYHADHDERIRRLEDRPNA